MTVSRGFGVAGALDRRILSDLAPHVEQLGYRTFWVNDTPVGDGLEGLAHVAGRTQRIRLGVGVIPLDRRSVEEIAGRIKDLELPNDRLTVGVGAGASRQGLTLVREGVESLRGLLHPTVKIAVAALGPRMCRLAGEYADDVLLNWLTPDWAVRSAHIVRDAASNAGRDTPDVTGYVRVAMGKAAVPRLEQESARYEQIPSYARHFARMGTDALLTTVAGNDAASLQAGLSPFNGVFDETVVRAITSVDTASEYMELAEACAPADER
jgi:alkanesulfonate monooxygenase SsuD/methylene tetrahydromethanopterin reductase-like flavin-dependent oxidoreductase (luciferase family)